jgi:glutamate synthase domain-containing protein 1/glutamate synthase domain-containing protein 3
MSFPLKIIKSRSALSKGLTIGRKTEAEGGCGVIGVACSEPIAGKHLLTALVQMKNRGNGKGGGIAAAGLSAESLGVSEKTLRNDYLILIAYLDTSVKNEVEREFIFPVMDVDSAEWVETVPDHTSIGSLQVKPPDVMRYFCRVKEDVLRAFMQEHELLDRQIAEDEFVYQNSYRLNRKFYASLGDKKAFVLSHGKDIMVFKIVGYGDQVIRYYKLEDFKAHVWIGHHRYPTKGRVWHPGGAHPFVGLHEALVHNGDFSNYHSIAEYLAQRNIYPLFLTDTEVAVYLFDLWKRVYGYPTELLIEAMAPTTERDLHMLPEEKRRTYREIQVSHIHGSPDGPWFFIVARSENGGEQLQLLGITDTSMLRPQVFALQEGKAKIGLIASERQAIDAYLRSLSRDESRFSGKADVYWNARGGSYTDGGAFIFNIDRSDDVPRLICTDKFGREVNVPEKVSPTVVWDGIRSLLPESLEAQFRGILTQAETVDQFCDNVRGMVADNQERISIVQILTWMIDNLHRIPYAREGRIRDRIELTLFEILRAFPPLTEETDGNWRLVNSKNRASLRGPKHGERVLVMDASDMAAEGDCSASALIVEAYRKGWKQLFSFDWRGQRFCGVGLGPHSSGFRIDVFGNPGDYLGSGLDGAEIYVHASAQDQVAQIMKSGKLVIYGDVGQTFMYAAKGGEVFVLGNAAGRPLINAVGHPRVVINGTCLDYLAESFMAGEALNGGGFVIMNSVKMGDDGRVLELETPYPGGNLFSLASGGAIYVRDPLGKVGVDQLNGGRIRPSEQADWQVIQPYLKENERLFGIKVEDLLKIEEDAAQPSLVYRKVDAVQLEALAAG